MPLLIGSILFFDSLRRAHGSLSPVRGIDEYGREFALRAVYEESHIRRATLKAKKIGI
jgi:hypothetical protein